VLGSGRGGRFNSRGEDVRGSRTLELSAWIRPGFYLRDGLLRHKSGTLGFQAMFHETQGLKYRGMAKMDPSAFVPFLSQECSREVVGRFGFKENSSVFVRVEGAGREPPASGGDEDDGAGGTAEAFTYKGVEFDAADGELEIQGPAQTFRQDQRAPRRGDGGGARKCTWITTGAGCCASGRRQRAGWTRMVMMGCFAPKVADYIARYKLSSATGVVGVGHGRAGADPCAQ